MSWKRMVGINEVEWKKEKLKRNEDRLRDLWENAKHPNIQIIGIPEKENKRKGHEKIFGEIIVKNFPIVVKDIAT